jgi:hypothetical protein
VFPIPTLASLKMALMAGAALALVTGTAYVTHRFDAGKLEQFKAAQYKQAAEDNAKALLQQTAHDAAVHDAIATLNQVSSERDQQSLQLKKAINNAPEDTRLCRQPCYPQPA